MAQLVYLFALSNLWMVSQALTLRMFPGMNSLVIPVLARIHAIAVVKSQKSEAISALVLARDH